MKAWLTNGLLAVALLAAIVGLPLIGGTALDWPTVFFGSPDETHARIFWQLRVPRVLVAVMAGGALSLGGMVFQGMFRNPLVTPFTLGVSSGAACGAALYIKLSLPVLLFGVSGLSLAAFAGALAVMLAVFGLSYVRGQLTATGMLLAGVAMSFFFGSLILLVQYLSDFTESYRIVRWLMGGLEVVSYSAVRQMLPFVTTGAAIIFWHRRELNLLLTGETLAANRGVNVDRTRQLLFVATSLMLGAVVAVCGPIGFVGLVAPHICRLVMGPDHRALFWASLLFGGLFLAICDTVARTIIAPAEIPVGVITALLGGPFFLWLLLRDRARI